MKLHLLLINILFISSATIQIYSMHNSLESKAPDYIVRTVAFGASSTVAGIGLGIGSLGLLCAYEGALGRGSGSGLTHPLGSAISVPAMLVGSLATYSALLAVGIKDKPASKVSGTLFGVSMLINSLSHWINLKNPHERDLCVGMGVFTGLSGLAVLWLCLRR